MKSNWEHRAKTAIKKRGAKEFDTWSKDELIDHILELRQEINVLSNKNTRTEEKQKKGRLQETQFKKTWSVPTKIVFILHLLDKPLLSSEIYTKLIQFDKSFKDYSSSKTVLSNYLTRSSKTGRIKKIKLPGIKTHYFALPDWMDGKGNLIPAYKSSIKEF